MSRVVLLCFVTAAALFSNSTCEVKTVTPAMEKLMREALRDAIHTTLDTDGFRLLTGGILRACFHDCLVICDGCLDLDRVVSSFNNGVYESV